MNYKGLTNIQQLLMQTLSKINIPAFYYEEFIFNFYTLLLLQYSNNLDLKDVYNPNYPKNILDKMYKSAIDNNLDPAIAERLLSCITSKQENEFFSKYMSSIAQLISQINNDNKKHETYNEISEQFLNYAALNNYYITDFCLPLSIAQLITKIADLKDNSSILNLDCGCGIIAGKLILQHKNKDIVQSIYCHINNQQISDICSLHMLFSGAKSSQINLFSKIQEIEYKEKFDYIIGQIPINPNNITEFSENYFYYSKKRKDLNYLYYIINNLMSYNSKFIVIVPNSILYRSSSEDIMFREFILSEKILSAVITLPTDTFYNTRIPMSVIILDKSKNINKISLIDFSSQNLYYTKIDKKNVITPAGIDTIHFAYREKLNINKLSVCINYDQIEKPFLFLTPSYYISNDKFSYKTSHSDSIPKIIDSINDYSKKLLSTQNELKKYYKEYI